MKSLPFFATNYPRATVNESNLRPLLAYVLHDNSALGGWLYNGILFANTAFYIGNGPSQSVCDAYINNLFVAGGWLDTLNTVVGVLKTELGDSAYLLNVMLATCYAPEKPNGNAQQNNQAIVDQWSSKAYTHLTLAGFFWEYVESPNQDPSSNCVAESVNSWLHELGLTSLWIPWYLAWRDMTTCATTGHDWRQWGLDYVVGQPNYAFYCPRDWNRFSTVNQDLSSYPLAGVEFEISGLTSCGSSTSLETNANSYLDAGFQYGWMKKSVNVFWWAPNFLSNYALGKGSIPGFGWSYEPQSYDRAIYDRIWQFVRGYQLRVVNPNGDATVRSYTPDANYGTEDTLYLGTNAVNKFRPYLQWSVSDVPLYSYVMRASLKLYLREWFYGTSLTDGQLYYVSNDDWTELGITWNNQPSPSTWTLRQGGLVFQEIGWYSFDVTLDVQTAVNTGDSRVTFMLKRATEDFTSHEPKVNSREWANSSLRPQLEIEYVESKTVRQIVTEDSYVMGAAGFRDNNYGSVDVLIFGTNAYPNMIRPYLKFRLDGFRDAATMYDGSLVVSIKRWRYGNSITDGELYFVTDNGWQEMTVTFNNQPSSSTWQLRMTGLSFGSGTAYRFYVESDLTNQKSAGQPATFMFKRSSEDGAARECEFYSKETTTNLNLRPEIWVTLKPY